MATKNDNKQDLPDSPGDKEKLQSETATINLPDVKDIPGQEHVHVPPFGELADTTISSADEEGENVFGDRNEEIAGKISPATMSGENAGDEMETPMEEPGNVTDEEREALKRADQDMPTDDDLGLRRAALDSEDMDGDPLNEGSFKNDISGDDLDVPGAEDDDENESIGEEDEENNPYSLGGDNHN
jgi:hypothetical protein